MTRRQALMAQALDNVQQVPAEAAVRQTYGGLCHALPVLIRRNGLCQTVAFLDAKACGGSAQKRAYALIRDHLAAALGQSGDALLPYVAEAPLGEYMLATHSALMAWEFYKRFAVSLLGVDSADTSEEPA
jgi:CRISPR-associated protein Cmr5